MAPGVTALSISTLSVCGEGIRPGPRFSGFPRIGMAASTVEKGGRGRSGGTRRQSGSPLFPDRAESVAYRDPPGFPADLVWEQPSARMDMSGQSTRRFALITGAAVTGPESRPGAGEEWMAYRRCGPDRGTWNRNRSASRGGRGSGEFHPLDVRDGGQWERLRDDLQKRWPQLDLLINNAGVSASGKWASRRSMTGNGFSTST